MRVPAIALSATVVLGFTVPATAQQQPLPRAERPYRGLFGGGVGDAEQLLTLNMSLGSGYDDNILADVPGGGGTTDPRAGKSGTFGSGSAQLTYGLTRTRVGVNASVGTSGRFYPDAKTDNYIASHGASIGAFVEAAKNTRLSASHTTSYQPFLTLGLFPSLFDVPGQAIPPSPELAVSNSEYFNHTTGAELTQQVSRRASLSGYYSRQWADFKAEETDRDFSSQGGGGRLTVGLSKGLGVRIGYGYTDAVYSSEDAASVQGHNIDAGVDFNRALSFSRRTTFSFGTGSSVVVYQDRTYYRLLANAKLNREIGRTWNASLAYARSSEFVASLPGPVFSDALSAFYGGMVNRRLQFSSSAAAAIGNFAATGNGTGFDTYTGNVGLTYGITRELGIGVNYSYYRYSFDEAAPLPIAFARQTDRNSVQAYLTVWMPIVHRARRSDAAR